MARHSTLLQSTMGWQKVQQFLRTFFCPGGHTSGTRGQLGGKVVELQDGIHVPQHSPGRTLYSKPGPQAIAGHATLSHLGLHSGQHLFGGRNTSLLISHLIAGHGAMEASVHGLIGGLKHSQVGQLFSSITCPYWQ